MFTSCQKLGSCLLNVWVVRMHVGRHVQRPFHMLVSAQMLHQHRNVKEHVEVVFEMRTERIQRVRSVFHATVFDVVHRRNNLLVNPRGWPRFTLGPRPDSRLGLWVGAARAGLHRLIGFHRVVRCIEVGQFRGCFGLGNRLCSGRLVGNRSDPHVRQVG